MQSSTQTPSMPGAPEGLLDFSDRVVVITGTASGIGHAAAETFAEAGAHVQGIDIAPQVDSKWKDYRCDLSDPDQIPPLVASLPASVDVLVNCAGVPNGGRFSTLDVMTVNWFSLQDLTEAVMDRMPAGSAVTHVASTAGRGWPQHRELLEDLLPIRERDARSDWVERNASTIGDGYAFSKEAVQYYTIDRAVGALAEAGIRVNGICPGVTNTGIADDFRRGVGDEILDRAIEVAGRMAEPHEMAPALLFLSSDRAAGYINGVNLNVDRGTGAAHLTGRF